MVALLASALVLRLAMITVRPPAVEADETKYDYLALQLVDGAGFSIGGQPTALRPPGFPLFLAGIYKIFGHSYVAVAIAHALIGTLLVLLTFRLGLAVFDARVAGVAASIVAFHPASIAITPEVLTEPLFTFVFTGGVALLVGAFVYARKRMALWAGLLLGLATLIRPTPLFLPLVVAAVALWLLPRRAETLTSVLAFMLAFFAAILPWTIRNYVRLDSVHLISTSSFAPQLWWGSYRPWNLEWRGYGAAPLDTMLSGLHPTRDAAEVERRLIRAAWRNVRSDPGGFSVLAGRKLWALWRPIPGGRDQVFGSNVLLHGLRAYHIVFLLLSLVGLVACFNRVRDCWFLGILIYWNVVHAMTIGVPRYLLPLTPLLALYAAAGLLFLLQRGTSSSNAVSYRRDGVAAART